MLQMVYLFHNDNGILGKRKVSHKAVRSLILKVVACSFAESYYISFNVAFTSQTSAYGMKYVP